MICVADISQPYHYHAITVDTENKRIFWIKEIAGSFKIGMADYYENGSCINHVNKIIVSKLSVGSSSDRISMAYVAGILLHTSSALPNMIFITASNFSSFPSPDYQLAVGQYNISTGSDDVNILSIIASQRPLPVTTDSSGTGGSEMKAGIAVLMSVLVTIILMQQ